MNYRALYACGALLSAFSAQGIWLTTDSGRACGIGAVGVTAFYVLDVSLSAKIAYPIKGVALFLLATGAARMYLESLERERIRILGPADKPEEKSLKEQWDEFRMVRFSVTHQMLQKIALGLNKPQIDAVLLQEVREEMADLEKEHQDNLRNALLLHDITEKEWRLNERRAVGAAMVAGVGICVTAQAIGWCVRALWQLRR